MRRDLSRTVPGREELLEDVVAEKETGLEACWMSQTSSSSWGVSTSAWEYRVGLCRNIAASRSSPILHLHILIRPGPLACSPPFHYNQNGRRREGTSNMRLGPASHLLMPPRSKRLRVGCSLLHILTPIDHGSSSEEMARSTALTIRPFFT